MQMNFHRWIPRYDMDIYDCEFCGQTLTGLDAYRGTIWTFCVAGWRKMRHG